MAEKLTPEEIKKALECCSKRADCDGCYYGVNFCKGNLTIIVKYALDLINRQQATIETLRGCVERHHIIRKDGKSPLSLLTAEIKSEAIKEFEKRLEEKAEFGWVISGIQGYAVDLDDIREIAKELIGE